MRVGTARLRVVAAMCAMLAGVLGGARAQAPPGWKAVLRIRPNPIPLGRCTNLQIEVQDPDGFRTGLLSNGQAMNQRQFTFTSSDVSSFSWRGDPTDGVICANPNGPPATTTIRIALPDGIVGSVQLTSLGPGQTAPQVVYAPQAPLRVRGAVVASVATPLTNGTSSSAPGANSGGASAGAGGSASAGASTGADASAGAGARAAGSPQVIVAPALPAAHALSAPKKAAPTSSDLLNPTGTTSAPQVTIVGAYWMPVVTTASAPSLTVVGAYWMPGVATVTAPAIQVVGAYGPHSMPTPRDAQPVVHSTP